MKLRDLLNIAVKPTGNVIKKYNRVRTYDQDGLWTTHNHDFQSDMHFSRSYLRGIQAASGNDFQIHWRAHIALWAGHTASQLSGDFVECGVGSGFLSSAIMEFLNWNSLGKTFYLLDTFEGLDSRFLNERERSKFGSVERQNQLAFKQGLYGTGVDAVKSNFQQWDRVRIIQGSVPNTLDLVDAKEICYLHLDMNCALPEQAAFEYFWDRLTPGAVVLLDDYGFQNHVSQKEALDNCARRHGVMIASLPTGQGLLIKSAKKAA